MDEDNHLIFEIDLLRKRLKEQNDLLSVSYHLIEKIKSEGLEKSEKNINDFKEKLIEFGAIQEKSPSP